MKPRAKPIANSYMWVIYFRVYCKYHYLEGHETPNAEVEIWNFLVNISKNEVNISKVQYTEETQTLPFSVKSEY